MAYSGKYKPKNIKKYVGDINNVTYRSLWERNLMRWLDSHPDVLQWNSEEIVVPYICQTDKRRHRYFIDFYFKTIKGEVYLIEVKPKKETVPPKTKRKRSKRYITEAMTFVKNQSKWAAATAFANQNNCKFEVWTEDTLRSLGIKI